MDAKKIIETDVCILGAGVAGLATALKLPSNNSVTIISSLRMGMSASAMSQGGIAAAVTSVDGDAYAEDIINAGDTLVNKDVINDFVAGSAKEIAWLEEQGVNFHKKTDGSLCIKKEEGHNAHRLVHVKDETGKSIMTSMHSKVYNADNINILYEHTAIEFITRGKEIIAVKLLNMLTKEHLVVKARCFVLATGGARGVFARNTNPCGGIGGGVALAWRAGCSIANMEFQHFCPACFDHVKTPSLFINGSLFGKDVYLSYENGGKFAPAYNNDDEFLPVSEVARIILDHKKTTGQRIYVNLTSKQKKWIKNTYPAFYRTCSAYGIDVSTTKIPVLPAAHYSCGGVVVDENGLTTLRNLYAVGEVAYTGLYGASVFRSISIMGGLVFASKASAHISKNITNFKIQSDMPVIEGGRGHDFIFHDYNNYCQSVQSLMWSDVGVIRNNRGLLYAKKELLKIHDQVEEIYLRSDLCYKVTGLRNMVLTALIITQSAILRKESRGAHYNEDYPQSNKDYDGVVPRIDSGLINFEGATIAV